MDRYQKGYQVMSCLGNSVLFIGNISYRYQVKAVWWKTTHDDRNGNYDDMNGNYDDRNWNYDDRNGNYDDRNGNYDDRNVKHDSDPDPSKPKVATGSGIINSDPQLLKKQW